ncbi:DUF1109 domain-containing protein [Ancylobacter dichloromethanicus]|uniref:DUF1109 domain-containing protein n=1 Tax=Ancylobacter dichloromethanicus TaxID=518825 RepID=A0A9W6J7C2_9HYPH|nr:NrsF family protein [Ancylobacter dichloromethanicus]MBS7555453.1 DUF1109 domain-containing protein [Ancylobacter dichloromethanicus]GLK70639.1 hypothetical protein GCM10017643_07540 [Ancylobacter dichloromethanicus]
MITTPDLIASLSANATPVRRLRPPLFRACCWLFLAFWVLVLLGVSHGLRPDFVKQLGDRAYVVGLVASLLTGVLATVAAFMLSLPDRSRLYALLPVPSLLVWLLTISVGCLTDWVAVGPEGMKMGEAVSCFATLVLTSLPLSLALLVMLRYTARLRPVTVIWMGSLAVGALTASALTLFHDIGATVMILMWNLGAACLIIALGRIFGHRMLSWVAPQPLDHAA